MSCHCGEPLALKCRGNKQPWVLTTIADSACRHVAPQGNAKVNYEVVPEDLDEAVSTILLPALGWDGVG